MVSRTRLATGLVAALVLLVALAALSLAIGARSIPPDVVWHAIWGGSDADRAADVVVVRDLRLPRTCVGLLAGVALGLAGTLMQGLTRNPLADPGLLGVNAGAALAVVCGIAFLGISSASGYVWLALAGAALASVAVYLVGSAGGGGGTPVTLALAGAALTALLTSLVTLIVLRDVTTFEQYRFWEVGALTGRGLDVARQVLPFVAVGAVLALASGRSLNALALGEDVARALGQRIGLTRLTLAIAIVLLCGAATAAAGPISFVGLAVPHAARLITGPDFRWMLGYSAVLAPMLLLGADTIGRVVAPPGEVSVGVVTAFVGPPVLIALVRRRRVAPA